MHQRKAANDFAETAVLPDYLRPDHVDALGDAAAEGERHYREYLRFLDELPMLVDVVSEPPRVPVRDFRLGQRPDARKTPREDAAVLRERHALDVAEQYAEYVSLTAAVAAATATAKRKGPRKSAGQKKRAKRAKRSARSSS